MYMPRYTLTSDDFISIIVIKAVSLLAWWMKNNFSQGQSVVTRIHRVENSFHCPNCCLYKQSLTLAVLSIHLKCNIIQWEFTSLTEFCVDTLPSSPQMQIIFWNMVGHFRCASWTDILTLQLFQVKSRYKQNINVLCTGTFAFHHQVSPCQNFQAEMLRQVTIITLIKISMFTIRQIICVTGRHYTSISRLDSWNFQGGPQDAITVWPVQISIFVCL
jgi:hypothetical protein